MKNRDTSPDEGRTEKLFRSRRRSCRMGNGTSQSVMLSPSRSLGHSVHPIKYERSPAKYAHPNNRVLPKPIAGQRLRSTDNGHILHSAGTIRGRKSTSPAPQDQDEADPEVLDILKRRSELIEREHDTNLRGYRMFHSNPDISQSRPTNGYSPEVPETLPSRRTNGGVAAKTNKLKQRKKSRAPEPPPSDLYQGQFQRRAQSTTDLTQDRNGECMCINALPDWRLKTRAPPPPPPQTAKPPNPPPLPTKITPQRQHEQERSKLENDRANSKTSDNVTKRVPLADGGLSQGTNLSHSIGDLRPASNKELRTTVFDSKANLSRPGAKPALLSQLPDPFQKEIEAVTRKIARGLEAPTSPKVEDEKPKELQKAITPKQYYFSDKDVFRVDPSKRISNVPQIKGKTGVTGSQVPHKPPTNDKTNANNDVNNRTKPDRLISKIEESPLERFSPNRKRIMSPVKGSSEDQSRHNEDDSDIDVRLRPVLPRKAMEPTKFSPSEAWQALGSDDPGCTNRSTSDESVPFYNRESPGFLKQRQFGGFSGMALNGYPSRNRSASESQWTPRQDLEDSDTSSLNSDDAVIPKSQLGEFPTTFSLPTVMFSNIRGIGSDISSKRAALNYHNAGKGNPYPYGQMKNKPYKNTFADSEANAASHFRKFLGMRNKYLSEEDVSVSDSNWTFGGYGLQQKRGKQYSSDLLLSDKKKYELVVQNNIGELLGDVMVTKAGGNNKRNNRKPVNTRKPDFSFYSTEGHVMYLPKSSDGEEYSMEDRSLRDKIERSAPFPKRERPLSEIEKSSSVDLIRMLEEDARRRRSKEKMCIRKQLRMMKRLDSEIQDTDDEEEEMDEAYFTEPKSLEGSSPLYFPSRELRYYPDLRKDAFHNRGPSSLTHWTSSPSLLNDIPTKPHSPQGFVSSSSVTSSPDLLPWQKPPSMADRWMQRKQQSQNRRYLEKQRRVSEGDSSPVVNRRDTSDKFLPFIKDQRKSSGPAKEKKTSIYKQLMDIVRKEERAMKKEQGDYEPSASRDSSYSQRESSHSSSSPDSVSSSSYSDSSGAGNDYSGKSGVPANNEFHTSTMLSMQRTVDIVHGKNPQPFHASFAQPFAVTKGYRHVPFDVAVPTASANCRMPTLQEDHKVQAEVS